ncbi:hypothetical protein CTAYLR_003578 [Chrysophaeum taylorii]|uniref:DNA 3'-5' helicase n=1 Tax=Chrysophaeum taylorii TaxID=2483200 RepID=A0AAD7ULJ5_9STRA|nr:hypothetical protein CTAYLR_003578 [Chrysophaeum taylorii]
MASALKRLKWQESAAEGPKKTKKKKRATEAPPDEAEARRRRAAFFVPRAKKRPSPKKLAVDDRLRAAPDASTGRDHSRTLRCEWEIAEGPIVKVLEESTHEPPPPPNEEQLRIVEARHDCPAVVFAGAGTGKTQTIVTRVSALVERGVERPERILLLTFSVKASHELRCRVDAALGHHETRPTVKTFHALAFAWLTQYHRALGYAARPTPLTTASGKRRLMLRVLREVIVEPKRLARCRAILGLRQDATWDDVIEAVRSRDPSGLGETRGAAAPASQRTLWGTSPPPPPPPPRCVKKKSNEDDDQGGARFSAYASLLAGHKPSFLLLKEDKGRKPTDDLAKAFLTSATAAEYVKMIDDGKRRGHGPEEYLPEQARVWIAFEAALKRECQVTFDVMLEDFLELLTRCEAARRRFEARHGTIMVDEYQDNNAAQSSLLFAMLGVTSAVAVVGDDDQSIYGFSGADVGNFERFSRRCRDAVGTVSRFVLTRNYRCSRRILAVGCAFLAGVCEREPKRLEATRGDGAVVRRVACGDQRDQFDAIVAEIERLVSDEDFRYADCAVLFRCFKAGPRGALHRPLQLAFQRARMPYAVVGSASLFERATAQDLAAYLRLAVQKDPVAFARVFNTPPRRLSPKVLEAIEAARLDDSSSSSSSSLEDAARRLVRSSSSSLTKAQRANLDKFLELIDGLRRIVFAKTLPDLVDHIWECAGFAARAARARERKKEDLDTTESSDDPRCSEEDQDDDGSAAMPAPARAVRDAAENYAASWKRDRAAADEKDDSLFALAAKKIRENVGDIPVTLLPPHLLDLLETRDGRGPGIIAAFLASLALQTSSDPDDPDDSPAARADKIVISTIHRAKGLEWRAVFVPYFNDGLFPCEYRTTDHSRGHLARHLPDCPKRGSTTEAPCACAAQLAAQRRAEQRHYDEERRLAHVVATRAKDHLTFYQPKRFAMPAASSTRHNNNNNNNNNLVEPLRPSRFEADLRRVSESLGIVSFVGDDDDDDDDDEIPRPRYVCLT